MINIKCFLFFISFILSSSSLIAQTCPFVGKWKLIDVEKDKLSILDTTCTHHIILRIDTTLRPMNYSLAICDFMGVFQIKNSQLVITNKMHLKSISTQVICNWSVVMESIGYIENWSLIKDTLVLYNNQYRFTFKAF